MIKLLLLDRDGVINEKINNGYVTSISQLRFIESTFDFLKKNIANFEHVAVVTNQQGIAKNLLSLSDLEVIHNIVSQYFVDNGLSAPIFFVCPHLSGECECRKPKPRLILDAIAAFNSTSTTTLMIGDSISDVEAAQSANIGVVHLDSNCNSPDCYAKYHFLNSEIFSP